MALVVAPPWSFVSEWVEFLLLVALLGSPDGRALAQKKNGLFTKDVRPVKATPRFCCAGQKMREKVCCVRNCPPPHRHCLNEVVFAIHGGCSCFSLLISSTANRGQEGSGCCSLMFS